MKLSTLTHAKRIVAQSKSLTQSINVLENTTTTKVILVLSSGRNFSLYMEDDDQTVQLIGDIHKLVTDRLVDARQELRDEFEAL